MTLHVVRHPLVDDALARLRDQRTPCDEFRRLAHRVSLLLAAEATRDLPTADPRSRRRSRRTRARLAAGWWRCPCCAPASACSTRSSSSCPRPRSATSVSSATRRPRSRAGTTRRSRRTWRARCVPARPHAGHGRLGRDGHRGPAPSWARARSGCCPSSPRPRASRTWRPPSPTRRLHGGPRPRAQRPEVHPARARRLRRPAVRDVGSPGRHASAAARALSVLVLGGGARRRPAGGAAPAAGRLAFRVFNEDHGAREPDGRGPSCRPRRFLWVGTQNGFYRFDGRTFTAYGREPASRARGCSPSRVGGWHALRRHARGPRPARGGRLPPRWRRTACPRALAAIASDGAASTSRARRAAGGRRPLVPRGGAAPERWVPRPRPWSPAKATCTWPHEGRCCSSATRKAGATSAPTRACPPPSASTA